MPGALASDDTLEALAGTLKAELLAEIERRTGVRLDPDVLTVGVARRAATYKRPDLVLRDVERLGRLLKGRQLQLVFAGQGAPRRPGRQGHGDAAGPGDPPVAGRDGLPRELRHGARPAPHARRRRVAQQPAPAPRGQRHVGDEGRDERRAHCSILDGWWPEGCEHGVTGWAIGDGAEGDRPEEHDARDHAALYRMLEGEVLPAYADRPRWLAMMRASIRMAAERFSAERMVRDYFARLYADA